MSDFLADSNRKLIAAIRSEGRETFGTGRIRNRYKRCHEIAAKALVSGTAPADAILTQGIEAGREHSWLELPDGRVWDPVTCEFGTLHPQSVAARFTRTEAVERMVETGYWGWWAPGADLS